MRTGFFILVQPWLCMGSYTRLYRVPMAIQLVQMTLWQGQGQGCHISSGFIYVWRLEEGRNKWGKAKAPASYTRFTPSALLSYPKELPVPGSGTEAFKYTRFVRIPYQLLTFHPPEAGASCGWNEKSGEFLFVCKGSKIRKQICFLQIIKHNE